MDRIPRVHDLLLLRSQSIMPSGPEQPGWPTSALGEDPWVVVRRGVSPERTIAVGVRGTLRHERWAGYVDSADVVTRKDPKELRSRLGLVSRRFLPAFQALAFLEERLRGIDFEWGPGGSTGFELASGQQAVNEQSDLDLVLFAPERFDRTEAKRLWRLVSASPGKVDALVETPYSGFSLEEYVAGYSEKLLLRTQHGRLLGQNPWTVPTGKGLE
jgi:phosphoribosyl-dephospho-CoA transferase